MSGILSQWLDTIPFAARLLMGWMPVSLFFAVFAGFLMMSPSPSPAGVCLVVGEEQAVAKALEGNPGLRAVEARYRAAEQAVPQASALPDPRLGFNFLNLPTDTFDLDQEPMTQLQVKVSQAIPFPGKLSLKGKIARLRAEAALLGVEEQRLRLESRVRDAWWRLAAAKAVQGILKEGERLIGQALDVALVKYRVGKGLQQDVLMARLELDRIRDRSTALEGRISLLRTRLAALMGVPGSRCVDVEAPDPPELPGLRPGHELVELALASNPALKAAEKRVRAAEKGVKLARKGLLPDFNVGAAYGFRQGEDLMGNERTDFATFTFSMSIPLWAGSKQLPAVREKEMERATASAELSDLANRVQGEVAGLAEQYESLRSQVELYRSEILPSAERTAGAMLSAYRVNKVDFLNVIRAELALLNYRMELWNLHARARAVLAELKVKVGEPVIE